MTLERSSMYRGETREIAEAAYHADARTMARMGYAPASEEWSSVQEEVLTVRYVHAPELGSAVLQAVAEAEAERPVHGRGRSPSILQGVLRRAATLYGRLTILHGVGRLYARLTTELKVTLGAIAGMATGIAVWSLLVSLLVGDDPLILFVSLFALGFTGGLAGAMVALRRELRRADGPP